MREILFKARVNDGSGWVEGYYFKYGNEHFIVDERGDRTPVIGDTVCEFTGIEDKNGKKIFENDIVLTQEYFDRPYSDKRKSKRFLGVAKHETFDFKMSHLR